VFPDVAATAPTDPDAARFRLFDSVTTFLIRATSNQPIVLIIDDLQSADVPSLLLLQFLAGELSESGLLVIGTYRDVEVDRGHPLTPTLAELVRYQATGRLHLRGLEPADVARYVEGIAGRRPPRDVAAAIHRETDGNPLFLGEVVRLAAAEGRLDDANPAYWERAIPQGVREVIGLRVNRLSKECSRTLSLACVLGREFGIEPLEKISGLSRDELEEVIDEASVARIVGEVPGSPGRLRFAHALIRDTLYDELPLLRRTRLHARAGQALEELYRSDSDTHLAELAHHFFEAGHAVDGCAAVEYARRAGEYALNQLAYEESVRLYRMALRALDRQEPIDAQARLDVLLALGDAGMRAGDPSAGREAFLAAADAARHLHAPETLARAALGYGGRFVWARAGDDRKIVPLLEDALRRLGAEASPLRARLLGRLAGALRNEAARERRTALSAQAVEMARQLGDPATLAYVLDGRYSAIWAPDTTEERLAIADEIVALAEQIGDDERAFQGHHYRVAVLIETGQIAAMKRELTMNADAAEALHQPAQRWLVAVTVALLALFEGNFGDAEALIEGGYELGRRAESIHALGVLRHQEYALRREQGRAADMEDALTELIDAYWFWPWPRAAAVHLQAELGRTAEARRQFDACAAAGFEDWPLDNDWLLGLTLFADVCTYLGDVDRAAILYSLLTPYEDRNAFGHPEFSTGSVARSLANLATTMGRFAEAERHFTTALEHNTRMGARPWVAHTHHDRAMMLLRRGNPADRERAIVEMRQAAETARASGQAALETRAAIVLDRITDDVDVSDQAEPPSVERPSSEPNLFRREGEYWVILFDGHQARLHDTKGMSYLAALLAKPGRELHALELISAPSAPHHETDPTISHGRRDSGAVLDERAKREYRDRIADLQKTIDEAEAWNDTERAAHARHELDLVLQQLTAATGLGGRDRRLGSDAERARLNVTRAIRSAMARIREHHPALGRYLDRTVRTGTFCAYEPDPRATIDWKT
jgi:tetratricopeptide (TPR) repeat protein